VELILLRHPAPAIDADICYGRADLTLQPGLEDPRRLPAQPPPVATIVTSPLRRCRRLAERLGAERGMEVSVDARLAEMDFGRWELRRWQEIDRAEVDAWARDFDHARPHGGETVAELRLRVAAALGEVKAEPGPVLWVTHGGVIRAVCGILGAHDGWETRVEVSRMLVVNVPWEADA
jgi:alpha-ribazole phosphatase